MRKLWYICCVFRRLRRVGVPRRAALSVACDYIYDRPNGYKRYYNTLGLFRLMQELEKTEYRGERVTRDNLHTWIT